MQRINHLNQLKVEFIVLIGFCLTALSFYDCAASRPQSSVSQYQFNLNEQVFRIRSINSSNKSECCNELIGGKFLAIDFDQDRIIDKIIVGTVSLSEAQKIYDYGLEILFRENRIKELNPENHKYVQESSEFWFEIKSFQPANAKSFNEFKTVNKKQLVNPETIVAIDYESDGTLDEILKGTITLEKVQAQYSEVIKSGLEKDKLIKTGNTILVKR
ncbi:MAG: hypothetical protein V1681_02785 [Candidatus Neomarinimicrobiota bacterium]